MTDLLNSSFSYFSVASGCRCIHMVITLLWKTELHRLVHQDIWYWISVNVANIPRILDEISKTLSYLK